MKKISLLKAITLFLGVMLISASIVQCKKDGDLVKDLNRSFTGSADSTVFSPFYESNTVSTADVTPDVNDIIKYRSVQQIVHEYCGTSNCHGGPIAPKFDTYTDIMRYVVSGNPETSKLWEFITTNDFNKAMPPVNSNHELTITDKTIIYNWIKNGAKERPDLNDFRPAAISLIATGCASANCHNESTATGAWARNGLVQNPLYPILYPNIDTTTFTFTDQVSGTVRTYCQLVKTEILDTLWGHYKDSVKTFYGDTTGNASFRPHKTFSIPYVKSTDRIRGPLNTYDDILMDIMYPKSVRSNTTVQYTDPLDPLNKYYVKTNYLDVASTIVSRIDSTLLVANPHTGIYLTTQQGDMAYGDGGLKSHEIALIKAWYFADPNIPSVWKYGKNNTGIFKYRKTQNIIISQ